MPPLLLINNRLDDIRRPVQCLDDGFRPRLFRNLDVLAVFLWPGAPKAAEASSPLSERRWSNIHAFETRGSRVPDPQSARRATVCTRPADKPLRTLSHSRGEIL